MRVWVPGGRGMLGRAVVRRLQACGAQAIVTGREVDVSDEQALHAVARAHRPQGIVNCAAMTAVDACEAEAAAAMRVNAQGPAALARLAAQYGWPIVHVSTDYVFSGTAQKPYAEHAPTGPKTVYGRSKLAGEQGVWRALGQKAPGYVVRTAWLFGHDGANFVRTMLHLMRHQKNVRVVADQVGSPTYCDDVAAALCGVLGLHPTGRKRPAAPGTYHFANAGAVSWHGLATAIWRLAKQAQAPLVCAHVEAISSAQFVRPAARPAYSVLHTGKLAHALQAAPRPFEPALREYVMAELAQSGPPQTRSDA